MQTVVKYFTAAIFSFFGYIVTGDSREAATMINNSCVTEQSRTFSLSNQGTITNREIRYINLNPAATNKSCPSTTC
ncbi:hypothetical protein PP178_08240 [Zeaxanthinibacter sp. PT1]|uniref:hypothetical protein n=1 Tax=Zeaxanthinibacter TaxID=561554 RepID=UPI00234AB70F|nr:hypothetical protein [Zeaxanthinibacter sp. PT1]MDC6351542.1 hypothetical protein [Zeaxanthinibacter sp. PT1]